MSSSPETSTRAAGAHRAHREERDRGAARALARRPPTPHEPYLDGLFTYCLSVLCDHDAATAALADVLALADRRRGPDAPGDRRAWLYALARWACLRGLTEARRRRQGGHASGRTPPARPAPPAPAPGRTPADVQGAPGAVPAAAPAAAVPGDGGSLDDERRRELALLAWPEAAGTTPEQREALELAVRHHLAVHEVAAVLGRDPAAARDLLASAACEVERTRAALLVVETGGCPGVSRLTGDRQLVLSPVLRRELVRHVDDCPRCRRGAERAQPAGWPGAGVTPAQLPVLSAPRAALHTALAHSARARGAALPRFDRRGFPMDPKDRAARRDRIRARAVTTTVVATVVAAPVLALWAAYRGGPADDGADARASSASEARDPDSLNGEAAGGYENTGNAAAGPGNSFREGADPDVSVEVIGVGGTGAKGAGRLDVRASGGGATTLVTLTASGSAPVRWSAATSAPWLRLSRASGTLAPGESSTIQVRADPLREPSGAWSAHIAIAPAGAVVSIDGHGPAPSPTGPAPSASPSTRPTPGPSATPSGRPSPSGTPPTSPEPTPTGTAPTDPGSSPPPGGGPSPSTS
ncbi:hypothetical protein RM863_35090 [Streptomyces sp. DSM 41014]|uniref:BACON domain-containing protein n=1 Tax=Streptomyces hintoniae TaxID=3075521 RepID=A0ABU2UVN1_9ACTN|nr:hypothetical protein [Streptomyces sp. DSM 41014]MDT0477360.1 hypothetical protein [Streptomyces sp. DSM 41014]